MRVAAKKQSTWRFSFSVQGFRETGMQFLVGCRQDVILVLEEIFLLAAV
jgi:hypothetical protein